jgi:hypothetical protein
LSDDGSSRREFLVRAAAAVPAAAIVAGGGASALAGLGASGETAGTASREELSLASATLVQFAPCVGTPFTVRREGARDVRLVLAEARAARRSPTHPEGIGRPEPFSLVFSGPREPVLAQRIHRLEHAALGRIDLFIVPIGRDAVATRYEAVFG